MSDTDNGTDGQQEEVSQEVLDKAFKKGFDETGNRESDFSVVDDNDGQVADGEGGESAAGANDDTDNNDNAGAGDEEDGQGEGGEPDKGKQQQEPEPTIKDVLAMVSSMQSKIETNLTRNIGGTVGRLLDARLQKLQPMQAAQQVAKESAQDKGKAVPAKERVAEAMKSVAGFAELEKDFPEYAKVLKEGLSMIAEMQAESKPAEVKPIDENAIVDKAVQKMQQSSQQAAAAKQAEEAEFAKIEDAWPGWKSAINEPQFATWSQQKLAGPDGKEYERIFASGSYRETISVLHEFTKETGVQPKKPQNNGTQHGNGQNTQSDANKNRQRRAASRPNGSATAPTGSPSEQEIFQRSFKERRGG